MLKIKLASLEDGITSLGMRHMASFVKSIQLNTESSYLSLSNFRSSLRSLLGASGISGELDEKIILGEVLTQLANPKLDSSRTISIVKNT